MKLFVFLTLMAVSAKADIPIGYQYVPCGYVQQPPCDVINSPTYPALDTDALQAALLGYYGDSMVLNYVQFNINGIGIGSVWANYDPHDFIYDQGQIICCVATESWLHIQGINDNNLIVGETQTIGSEVHADQLPVIWNLSDGNSIFPNNLSVYGIPDSLGMWDLTVVSKALSADNKILVESPQGMALLEPIYDPPTAAAVPEPSSLILLGLVLGLSAWAGAGWIIPGKT